MKRIAALAIFSSLLWAQDRPGMRTITAVRHWTLGDVTRVAVEVSSDFKYRTERLHNPDRVYFDIADSRPRLGQRVAYSESLDDPRVKRLRVAETVPGVTRIVLDLGGPSDITTTQLANPDRLMVEVRTGAGPAIPTVLPSSPPPVTPATAAPVTPPLVTEAPPHTELPKPDPMAAAGRQAKAIVAPTDLASAEMVVAEPAKNQLAPAPAAKPEDIPKPPAAGVSNRDLGSRDSSDAGAPSESTPRSEAAKPARRDSLTPPAPTPSASPNEASKVSRPNSLAGSSGSFAAGADTGKAARHTASGDNSLVRELGLKISRVVIDPGHGGHDQGTQGARGLQEKELVLDVGKRVGKLIEEKMGAEVIYTRTDDTFIPLEGRTALANEKKADLFLSIHANSSPVTRITGVETYYLNFADNKEAMDVAARENANAHESIFELRDMVQKITLHEKSEESRDFANRIQSSLFGFSTREIPGSKNRGVKKAPFVVLIGAQMPSILAEIGFLSNPREEALLKRSDYRQKLAEALFRGVQRYADSLSHFASAQTQNRP